MSPVVALSIVCVVLAALLAYREWCGARERREAAKERAELCQRIQAPELAVTEHVRASRPDRPRPRPIAADDDKRFAEREEAKRG
jgi:hypothetical protein